MAVPGEDGDLQVYSSSQHPTEIQHLVDQRAAARRDKNWEEADRIRGELSGLGYEVEDSPEGPVISRK